LPNAFKFQPVRLAIGFTKTPRELYDLLKVEGTALMQNDIRTDLAHSSLALLAWFKKTRINNPTMLKSGGKGK
jgi:hypothetical protein